RPGPAHRGPVRLRRGAGTCARPGRGAQQPGQRPPRPRPAFRGRDCIPRRPPAAARLRPRLAQPRRPAPGPRAPPPPRPHPAPPRPGAAYPSPGPPAPPPGPRPAPGGGPRPVPAPTRHAEAAACCREALRLNPADPEAHNDLGNALAPSDPATAQPHYTEALR